MTDMGIRILVEDFPKCFDFYHDVLGYETTDCRDGVYANFTLDNAYFSIFKKQNCNMYHGYHDTGFQIRSDFATFCIGTDVEDIDIVYHELKKKGVKFMGEPRNMPDWGYRCVWFRDPEGNMLELGGDIK